MLRTTLALVVLFAAGGVTAARPAHLLADFTTTQMIIDTSGSGCVLFDIYVARTPAQRSQGLMHVESLGEFEGMIFLYDRTAQISMWMKNTLIPLDMLFVGADSKVAGIHLNAVPMSEDIISSDTEVAAVVELNAGAVTQFNIAAGNRIYLPGS